MRKSNPDFHHIRSYILMCVVSLTFSTIYAQTPEPKLTLKLQNTICSPRRLLKIKSVGTYYNYPPLTL